LVDESAASKDERWVESKDGLSVSKQVAAKVGWMAVLWEGAKVALWADQWA